MILNKKDYNFRQGLFLLFVLTVFLILFEMGMVLRIEISEEFIIFPSRFLMLGLFVFSILYFYRKNNLEIFFSDLGTTFSSNRMFFLILIIYLIYDFASLGWTEDLNFALLKYKFMHPYLFLLPLLLYFFSKSNLAIVNYNRVKSLFNGWTILAYLMAVITFFLIIKYGRTHYILRTSIQRNYNKYVLIIIISYLTGLVRIIRLEGFNKYLQYLAHSIILLPLFYTSGSRRAVLYLLALGFFALVIMIYNGFSKEKKNKFKSLSLSIGAFLISIILSFVVSRGYELKSTNVYNQMALESFARGEDPPSAAEDNTTQLIRPFRKEQPLSFKTQTIADGSGMGTRDVIWSIVERDLETFDTNDYIFGKGLSYQKDVFRTESSFEALEELGYESRQYYSQPHNLYYQNLLNGGLIKVFLVLSLIIWVIYKDIKIFIQGDKEVGLILLGIGFVILSSQFIDSSYGMLSDRMTWSYLFLVLASSSLTYKYDNQEP